MAKIKTSTKKEVVSVFQSKEPGLTTIYIEGEGYDKTTLAPKFDSGMYMRAANSSYSLTGVKTDFGGDNHVKMSTAFGDYGNSRAGSVGRTLVLPKQTAHCVQYNQTTNNSLMNIDVISLLSMDPNNLSGALQRIVDSEGIALETWVEYFQHAGWWAALSLWYNNITERHNMAPQLYQQWGNNDYYPQWPSIKDPNSDWVSLITEYRASTSVSPYYGIGRANFRDFTSRNFNLTARVQYNLQYIGQSTVSSQPIYLYNNQDNEYTQYITRHNVSAHTTTDLYYYNSAPTASGTNYGGARSFTSFGKQTRFSSKTFADPTSAGNVCWYTPYFDANLNYHPFFFQWNKSNDTFTRNSDITVVGDSSSVHMNNLAGDYSSDSYGMAAVMYNETFVNGGNRYLTVIPMHGMYMANDGTPAARTIITYAIDAANPKTLTHHSAVIVPNTIRQTVWLNDSRTLLGVFCYSQFIIYKWNNTTGWEVTSTVPNTFVAVGRDSTDRIWAAAATIDDEYCDIHLITPTAPARISITPASSSYNYTGTNINSTVAISAYNIENERIAVDVALSIDGTTMTFSGGATSTTVTTSTSDDVDVPIVITGAGLSDIVSNVTL